MKRPNNFIFVLSGPSGAGKTTLIKRLLKDKKMVKILRKIKTYTTRKPRSRGEDYVFLTKGRFSGLKRRGFFLETQRVYEDWYGTPKEDFQEKLSLGHILLCIDVKGARVVKRLYKDRALLIFVMPPRTEELERRIRRRGKPPRDFYLRLKEAKKEMEDSRIFDYIVVNKNFEEAFKRLKSIISSKTGKE